MTDALLVLALTSAACALPGVFLLLRNLSMMADAISHTVLLGIVLFQEPATAARLLCVAMILSGIVGLKLTHA